ncbi:hypothetical protein MNBD_NITROSPINAE04-2097 [hydrothermal vent metagenome]|uniref:ATP synthase F0 sector subunit b n=1 Tax=hydrothermal vent metagenome TaxID=652676 RepID=A0A3B1C7U8_9ZZZZ
MARLPIGFIVAVLALTTATASASGIELADSWSWARDGGRIFNAVITLGAIAYVVIRFGAPVLRRRAQLISEQFVKLEAARAKAEVSLREFEEKLNAIKAEGEKIKQEAAREGEIIQSKALEQTRIEAKRILEKAEDQIAIETDKAVDKIRREAVIAAIDMAEELLKKNISGQDQKKLLDEYVSGMEKMN